MCGCGTRAYGCVYKNVLINVHMQDHIHLPRSRIPHLLFNRIFAVGTKNDLQYTAYHYHSL